MEYQGKNKKAPCFLGLLLNIATIAFFKDQIRVVTRHVINRKSSCVYEMFFPKVPNWKGTRWV
jgi:hypothetical protein